MQYEGWFWQALNTTNAPPSTMSPDWTTAFYDGTGVLVGTTTMSAGKVTVTGINPLGLYVLKSQTPAPPTVAPPIAAGAPWMHPGQRRARTARGR